MRKVLLLVALLSACIEGPMGPAGPEGPIGPRGVPGDKGQDGYDGADGAGLVSALRCSTSFTLGTSSRNAIHDVYRFEDGSVLATCAIWTAGDSAFGTQMWKAGSLGAALGACTVLVDADAASFGFYRMESRGPGSSTLTYDDPGSPNHGRTFTMTCTSS